MQFCILLTRRICSGVGAFTKLKLIFTVQYGQLRRQLSGKFNHSQYSHQVEHIIIWRRTRRVMRIIYIHIYNGTVVSVKKNLCVNIISVALFLPLFYTVSTPLLYFLYNPYSSTDATQHMCIASYMMMMTNYFNVRYFDRLYTCIRLVVARVIYHNIILLLLFWHLLPSYVYTYYYILTYTYYTPCGIM